MRGNYPNRFSPNPSVDVVGIFDSKSNQLFVGAKSIRAVVREESRIMQHPIETGSIISDHRIFLPTEISLSVILRPVDYRDTYNSIKQYYVNGSILTVQTKSGTYTNQFISYLPHEETPDMFNTITMEINLTQVLFASSKFSIQPADPNQQSTTNRGNLQPQLSNPPSGSQNYQSVQNILGG